jgi:hypothetical protein
MGGFRVGADMIDLRRLEARLHAEMDVLLERIAKLEALLDSLRRLGESWAIQDGDDATTDIAKGKLLARGECSDALLDLLDAVEVKP